MKERISRIIFWILSIGMILWGMILSAIVFFINISMFLQALVIPMFGIVINPIILDKIVKKVFKTEVKYFSVIEFSLKFIGANFALIIAYAIFSFTFNRNIDDNMALQNFESILKIVLFVFYLGILFVSKNANKVAKYITFGVIYFICVIFSFASLQVHYVIMYLLNIVSSNDLDFAAYQMLMNDVLIPIKEAILTYIIFDTIMGNENRKQDKIDDMNVRKDRENKTTKNNIMTKCQLHSRKHKKKKKYTPYNFDEKKEYEIYNNIGEKYRREFTGEKPKVNEKHPDFDKYSEWVTYFENKFLNGISNNYDFKRYLNRKLRMYQRYLGIWKSVAIPFFVVEITLLISMNLQDVVMSFILTVVIIIFASSVAMYQIGKYSGYINFMEDCIYITENKNISHQ